MNFDFVLSCAYLLFDFANILKILYILQIYFKILYLQIVAFIMAFN